MPWAEWACGSEWNRMEDSRTKEGHFQSKAAVAGFHDDLRIILVEFNFWCYCISLTNTLCDIECVSCKRKYNTWGIDSRHSPSFTKPQRAGGLSSGLRETKKECQKKKQASLSSSLQLFLAFVYFMDEAASPDFSYMIMKLLYQTLHI